MPQLPQEVNLSLTKGKKKMSRTFDIF
uniref:Uncharacterized protein n=1 Tax=Arundo donax TaxID=35708 RepID=A0A0A9AQN1_ARUDO